MHVKPLFATLLRDNTCREARTFPAVLGSESSVQGHELLGFRWLRSSSPLKWVVVHPAHGIGIWQKRNTAELPLTAPLLQLGRLVCGLSVGFYLKEMATFLH